MPKNNKVNKKMYTQKDFNKDLEELESLINHDKKNYYGGNNNNNNNDDEDEDDDNHYGGYNNNNNNDDDEEDEHNYYEGGKKEYTGEYRNFKILEVDGKEVKLEGRVSIKDHQTPLNAAKKLLTSYAKHHELRDNGKIKLKIVYKIQETTRGSKNKIYGPYSGKYYKYNAEEAAKAKASGISFKFRPVVKLYKGNQQKGGARS